MHYRNGAKTDKNVLLLKTNMAAGHGGSSGRYDYLKEMHLIMPSCWRNWEWRSRSAPALPEPLERKDLLERFAGFQNPAILAE
jgi:hypothetical protein